MFLIGAAVCLAVHFRWTERRILCVQTVNIRFDYGMVLGMNSVAQSHNRTQIKICGFTQSADAVRAVELGADTLGLVFYPPSSRNITIEQAQAIVAAVPPFTSLTALFLNAEHAEIEKVLAAVPVSLLQFHGTESLEFCQSFNRPWLKSVSMQSTADLSDYCAAYEGARGFLLDSNAAGAAGGSGHVFDWSLIPANINAPLVLAGGLDVENVRQAVLTVQPCAVDVSTGVESAKGIKDTDLMRRFIAEVKAADEQINRQATTL